jgi:hypothetical protein
MHKPCLLMFRMLVLLAFLPFLTDCRSLPAIKNPVTPTPAGVLVFDREFKDLSEPWCEESHYDFGDFFCQDGELHLVARGYGNIATSSAGDFKDFILQAQMRSIEKDGAYGVVFRGTSQPATFYIFQLKPTGHYQLIKWSQIQEQNGELIPWTASDAIRKDQNPNELKVIAQGPQITLYVNGEELADIIDTSLTSGEVGPVATQMGHAAVSYVKAWELPETTQVEASSVCGLGDPCVMAR